MVVYIDANKCYELLLGQVEGVEHDSIIRLTTEARHRPLNGRVESQMVDLRAIWNAKFRFDRVALIGYFTSVNESRLIRSGRLSPIQ